MPTVNGRPSSSVNSNNSHHNQNNHNHRNHHNNHHHNNMSSKPSNTEEVGEAPRSDPGALAGRAAVLAASGGGSSGEEDAAGHRIYHGHGFQMPTTAYRRRGHQKSGGTGGGRSKHRISNGGGRGGSKSSKEGGDDGEEEEMLPGCVRPSDRVHFILGQENDDLDGCSHESHPLFSELAELSVHNDELEWRETARWIKFEEDVEEGGNRWSKPHVGTVSLHSLFELRSCLLNGTVILDMEASSLDQIADLILETMVGNGQLTAEVSARVKEALLRRHRHQHERKHHESKNRLPIIRSLADIGRNSSRGMFGSHRSLDKIDAPSSSCQLSSLAHQHSPVQPTTTTVTLMQSSSSSSSPTTAATITTVASACSTPPLGGNSGGCNFRGKSTLGVPGAAAARSSANSDASMPASPSSHSLHAHGGPDGSPALVSGASSSDLQLKLNQAFMRKIPHGSEADNILVGEIDYLETSITAFVRLKTACHLGDLTEVPVPTRFLFILLGPHCSVPGRYHEVGRAMATLMSDEVFHDVAYKSKNREDLLSGVDEFLDAVTILPPGAWDPSIRIEPPTSVPTQDARRKAPDAVDTKSVDSDEEEEREREASGLKRSGKWFGGLKNDIKRKAPWYWSDFKDAFVLQSIASIFFLYFACLTPIITFGGLLGSATGNNIATMESLMSGLLCGVLYGLFAGQPLTILGSTGPVLVFETILYDFCKTHDYHYLNMRLYIGLWMTAILFLMVATDLSYLVCYITRFTEENFATLISVIFIFKAFENLLHIGRDFPVDTSPPGTVHNYTCDCLYGSNDTAEQQMVQLQRLFRNDTALKWCTKEVGGTLVGAGCATPNYAPNLFYLSCILFAATYVISVGLKEFKNSPFFPTKVRQVVSDFAVPIAIASMTLADNWVGIATPKLFVPTEFKPTRDDRGWLIPLFHEKNPVWLIPVTILPAIFSTILIFMDQQITAVIINRKEYKLKKGCGYHLDLMVLTVLVGLCSVMGLPWFVAATVLAMTHVNSLKIESESAAPGEKPQFIGVREQRVTNIVIFTLVGLSVFFTPILQRIPMAVLYGVFLYMGTSSLKGSQFFERILIIFMPQKYQPDYVFLRHVPTYKVHIFTLIQVLCFALLWGVKSYKKISITFPLMLVVIILIRKLLDFCFSRQELKILDDIMPESTKRKKEEEKELCKSDAEGGGAGSPGLPGSPGGNIISNISSGNMTIQMANGNVMKVPVSPKAADAEPALNITVAMSKSAAWQSVNTKNGGGGGGKNSTSNTGKSNQNQNQQQQQQQQKKRGTAKDAKSEEEQKRLSTMREEDDEEDCGITIKVEAPTPVPHKGAGKDADGETPV